ncbi:MAG: hypothetical protein LBH25_10075 [Fibromonadaceae bacterium]|jgi:hypothetical protein|nr:hypothetical protein [Fibromonadaceae bacterium]
MEKEKAISTARSRFNYEVMAGISNRIPLIVIESKQDKSILHLMLTALLSRCNIDLWLYGRNEKEHYVVQYLGRNEPRRFSIPLFIPHGVNTIKRALTRQKAVLNYVLPRIGIGRVFAFHDKDFDWSNIEPELAKSACRRNQVIIVFTNNLGKGTSILNLKKLGFLKVVKFCAQKKSQKK